MLATRNTNINGIFERIVKDKDGNLIRIRFTVVEVNGQFQPQIISAMPFVQQKETVIALPIVKTPKVIISKIVPSFVSKISPTETLEFFMSQPTRAPSL